MLIDPDQEVCRAVELIFELFRQNRQRLWRSSPTSLNTIYAFLSGPMAGFGTANCFGAP